MNERHIAIVEVSNQFIIDALGLPHETILRRIYQDQRVWEPQSYFLTIEHPDLPVVREGAIPVTITPKFSGHQGWKGVMDDWGFPE